jgi:hypothetical protein
MSNERIAEVIAEALKPVFVEGRAALLRELKAVGTKPTGVDRVITQKEFQLILREGYSAVNRYL